MPIRLEGPIQELFLRVLTVEFIYFFYIFVDFSGNNAAMLMDLNDFCHIFAGIDVKNLIINNFLIQSDTKFTCNSKDSRCFRKSVKYIIFLLITLRTECCKY